MGDRFPLVLLRRFLVIAALMFWQGGFTFYASVVVPIGQSALGKRQQGVITQSVTNYLNLAGLVGLAVLGWEVFSRDARAKWSRRLGGATWYIMAITLVCLALVHGQMDRLLTGETGLARGFSFQRLHRTYLWLSTVQWACSVTYLACSLYDWSVVAKGHGPPGG
jgi:hypothetical protein